MKAITTFLSLILCVMLVACGQKTNSESHEISATETSTETQIDTKNSLQLLQGKWVSEDDKSAWIAITDKEWRFGYEGMETNADEKYNIVISNNLPQFESDQANAEYIVITNNTDTMEYEIVQLDDETLNIMYLSRMKTQIYKKAKP
jgi:hypothetical protein